MITTEKVDTHNKAQVNKFIDFSYRLYANHRYWVPPFRADVETQLNKEKHPFYEHSDADFFLAIKDGHVVGRIAALENVHFNQYHKTKQAQFYLFDCAEDSEAARALFGCVFDWAKARGLDKVVGPKGFGVLDGYGILHDGYEQRQMMNMMNYNYPYYVTLVEENGFEKEVDFVSCYLSRGTFNLPDRVNSIAERVIKRGQLAVQNFKTKSDLKAWAKRIGILYNNSFVNNWEYYPMTEREIKFILDNILTVADPKLIKIITHEGEAVGFLFGFPDVSASMQRIKGRLFPFGIVDLLMELNRTNWISLNGAGILPEYQGRGGNALLYSEMEKTVKNYRFEHADLTQVAETAVQMRHDLINVGGKMYKNHRVYHKAI